MVDTTSRNEGDRQIITMTETLGEAIGVPDDMIDEIIRELVEEGRLRVMILGDGRRLIALS